MLIKRGATLLFLSACLFRRAAAEQDGDWIQSPEGPPQHCRDDAGPPWMDDYENYLGKRYHDDTAATPMLRPDRTCPAPLEEACERKGAKAAYLDGPVDCGGQGWFCRIMPQADWVNPDYWDVNFAHCNASDADQRDDDGHCHGSSVDSTYGWWVRDHWFRGYAGTLHCCCDWTALRGLVNRCDYRREVLPGEAGICRDANEDHGLNFEDGCEEHASLPFADPLETAPDTCWTITYFADPDSVDPRDDSDEAGDEEDDEVEDDEDNDGEDDEDNDGEDDERDEEGDGDDEEGDGDDEEGDGEVDDDEKFEYLCDAIEVFDRDLDCNLAESAVREGAICEGVWQLDLQYDCGLRRENPPTISPTRIGGCLDSFDWHVKNKPRKDCSWTKGKQARCRKRNSSGVAGFDACPFSCGKCS